MFGAVFDAESSYLVNLQESHWSLLYFFCGISANDDIVNFTIWNYMYITFINIGA